MKMKFLSHTILLAIISLSVLNRFITPNGDGKNDDVVFHFDNPRDVAVQGAIYDLKGALVAQMTPSTSPDTLKWDGKSNATVVPSGVYIYQIEAEDKVFNGTVVVIR